MQTRWHVGIIYKLEPRLFLGDKERVKTRRAQVANTRSERKDVIVEKSALQSTQRPQPNHNPPEELLVSDAELNFLYDQEARRQVKAGAIVRA